MKLLLDHNLSPRLCTALQDLWPDVVHVRDLGLQTADDSAVWEYGAKHGFTIVSKDGDFNHLALLFGAPPKVVWVHLGNCSTLDIERVLRSRHADVLAFENDPDSALLIIGPTDG